MRETGGTKLALRALKEIGLGTVNGVIDKWRQWALVSVLVAENLALLAAWGIARWRQQGLSPVERGKQIAERLGCFTCHGPGGIRGITFAKKPRFDCPPWDGGTAMMYVHDESELAEWILDGAPKALRETASYQREQKERLVRMPAYRRLLSDEELRDLVAYWKAIAEWQMPPDDPQAAKGYEVAKASGCFSCHGPAGRGSPPNPGSFKGYIPAWDSADFAELVRDEAELEQWILDGVSERFRNNPAAQFFLRRAPIKMPAYRNYLSRDELEALKAYIRWLRQRTGSSSGGSEKNLPVGDGR